MTSRVTLIVLLLLLPGCLLFATGCTAPRLGDTHNTTLLIGEYNTWAAQQKTYSEQVRTALSQMGGHLEDYNREAVKNSPDTGLLQEDIAADRQLLDQWNAAASGLDSATDAFDRNTDTLDFAGDPATRHLRDLALQEMKIYSIDMANARQHLVDYNRDLGKYFDGNDPDYWNDGLRTAAMNAKAEALASAADGDVALANLTRTMQSLQDRQ
jgi:hypothetical protein